MFNIERFLSTIDYECTEKDVAEKLAALLLTIHNRLLANNKSPHCPGRDKVNVILSKAIDDLWNV